MVLEPKEPRTCISQVALSKCMKPFSCVSSEHIRVQKTGVNLVSPVLLLLFGLLLVVYEKSLFDFLVLSKHFSSSLFQAKPHLPFLGDLLFSSLRSVAKS